MTLPDFETLFWDTIFSFSPLWPVLTKVELDDFAHVRMSRESSGDSCGVMRPYFGVQFSHFPPFFPVLTKVELDDFAHVRMSGESAGDSCGVMRHYFRVLFFHFHPNFPG